MTKRCHFVRVSINPDINLGTAALLCELKYTIMFYCEPTFVFYCDDIISQFTNKINWFTTTNFRE